MNIDSLQLIQHLRVEGAVEAENQGEDAFESAKQTLQKHSQEAYDQAMLRVEKQAAARDTMSTLTLLGTIFGGLGIGSGIGMGIGELANDGDENAANDAQEAIGRADELTKRARDTFDEVRDDLEDLAETVRSSERTSRDIRDLGWAELGS